MSVNVRAGKGISIYFNNKLSLIHLKEIIHQGHLERALKELFEGHSI